MTRYRSVITFITASLLILLALLPNSTTLGDSFGRTNATGDWSDVNWNDSAGVSGFPGPSDNVYIGVGYPFAGWLNSASVDVTTAVSAYDVTLGSGLDTGNLNIDSTGSLTTTFAVNIYNGALTSSGSLDSPYLVMFGAQSTAQLMGTFNIGDISLAAGADLSILGSGGYTNSIYSTDSFLTIGSSFNAGTIFMGGGQMNMSADLNAGALALGWGGTPTVFNRSSGTLTLEALQLYDGSELTLIAGDTVQNQIIVDAFSTLTVDTPQTMAAISTFGIYGGTLNLNQDVTVGGLTYANNPTINRTGGARITALSLDLLSTNYSMDGSDTIINYVLVDNSTFSVDTATTLQEGSTAYSSTINVNNALNIGAYNLTLFNSTLNVNAQLNVDSSIIGRGGIINQSADIVADTLALGFGGTATDYNRLDGTLDLETLELYSGSMLEIDNDDSVSNVRIFDDSELLFAQNEGASTGLDLLELSIQPNAILRVEFDAEVLSGLDWGLRVSGDQQTLLNGFLIAGQIVSDNALATVIYDPVNYGDYTYYGFVTAVPEPSLILLSAMTASVMSMTRRRPHKSVAV